MWQQSDSRPVSGQSFIEENTDVFFREFATLYNAFAAGHPSPLPELPMESIIMREEINPNG